MSDDMQEGDAPFTNDGHMVSLTVEPHRIEIVLVCPEEHADLAVRAGEKECWLTSWFAEVSPEDMYVGRRYELTNRSLPMPISHRMTAPEYDPEWKFADDTE